MKRGSTIRTLILGLSPVLLIMFSRIAPTIGLVALSIARIGGNTFEPHDFDIEAALEKLGVAVSTLPGPEPSVQLLDDQSLLTPCSLAVSIHRQIFLALVANNSFSVLR
jgi:hypothetical protein